MHYIVICIIIELKLAKSVIEHDIVGESFTKYSMFPHSVYIAAFCEHSHMCGGSILNQEIILTAAHCTVGCERVTYTNVQVKYGHEDIQKMKTTYLRKFVQHKGYEEVSVVNDICLLLTRQKILLSNEVKRVIIMDNPPRAKYAHVAGWGRDDNGENRLKYTGVQIQELDVCANMGDLPHGVFCAGPVTGNGTAHHGDSGSALVIKECIQIGLVSFKVDAYSLVAYTNVSYFLDWIKRNSRRLVCDGDKRLS